MITSLTVDLAGVVLWTTTVTPSFWLLEQCFSDGTGGTNGSIHSGDNSSFDVHGAGFPGGFNLRLWGLDASQNLLISPFISTDTSHNQ